MHSQLLSGVWLFATPWTVAQQVPLSLGGQEYFPGKKMQWVAIFSSRGSSWPRDQSCISCISWIGRWILYHWPTWKVTYRAQVLGSVWFSHSVMSDSLRPHESQHARPPCPSPTPGVYSNSCPSSQWCHLLSSPSPLPPIPPSIRVFSSESTLCIRWPKYWSFSLSISPSNEHPGLICFRIDWLHLLAVQGTLKSLLQHHSSKASVFWCSAFFTVQLSHPYMTTGKTIALTRWTFVSKVMSLLFNMLSRLAITGKIWTIK